MKKYLSKLSCSLKSGRNLGAFYRNLTKDELLKRRADQKRIYMTNGLVWISTMGITAYATDMNLAFIVLYCSILISLGIALWEDYKKRISLIDSILTEK